MSIFFSITDLRLLFLFAMLVTMFVLGMLVMLTYWRSKRQRDTFELFDDTDEPRLHIPRTRKAYDDIR